jgi:hypothetical protein
MTIRLVACLLFVALVLPHDGEKKVVYLRRQAQP